MRDLIEGLPSGFRPPAWSFTGMNQFKTCPKQYAEVRVYKSVKEVMGAEADWGDKVHKSLEVAVRDKVPLPPEHTPYQPLVDMALSYPGQVIAEQDIALDIDLQRVDWGDKSAWLRGKIDLLQMRENAALVLDWKTGKVKPNSDQLRLFALMVFALYPAIQWVRTAFIWVKFRQRTIDQFTRDQAPMMWEPFRADYKRLLHAVLNDQFPARPSGLCNGWCPVTQCQHWKPKRN